MKRLLMAGLLALSLGSPLALAHGFHYRIGVDTKLVVDAQGHLTGLQMSWLHDADISKAMFEDEDMSAENRDQTIRQIGYRLVHDLQRLGYFTQLKLDGQALQTSSAKTHSLSLDSKQQMLLDFLLPLQTPVDLAGKTLTWTMQDPEGMGILTYPASSHITPPANCKVQLTTPPTSTNPDEEAQHPQTVTLSCS
jgi:ABC-type uncharacterized transport system substrate-binding protein